MRKTNYILLVLGITLSLITGCMLPDGEFNYIEHQIKKQLHPADVQTSFKFSFGPVSLGTAKFVADLLDEGDDAVEYLQEIQKVQLGVYEIREAYKLSSGFTIPQTIEEKLSDQGWERFLSAKDHGEQVALYYRQLNERISSMYVIVLDRNELVIVDVCGRLEKILEKALRDHDFTHKVRIDI